MSVATSPSSSVGVPEPDFEQGPPDGGGPESIDVPFDAAFNKVDTAYAPEHAGWPDADQVDEPPEDLVPGLRALRFGLDYCGGLTAAQHKAVGSTFALRYLSHTPEKNLTRPEAHELRSGGIDVGVVWETSANRAKRGYSFGNEDACEAARQAADCGIPDGRPIYFAIDYDAPSSDQGAINEYFRGVISAIGFQRTGVYAGYWQAKRLLDAHLTNYAWQTYAWSAGNVDPRTCVYQYSNEHVVFGAKVDYDHSFMEDFGQFDIPLILRFPVGPFAVNVNGKHVRLDERKVVEQVDGALQRPQKYHEYLTTKLYPELKALRDRIWTVAHTVDPLPNGKPSWEESFRGWRWQELNKRMKEIKQLK